jgi:hypothetical protein
MGKMERIVLIIPPYTRAAALDKLAACCARLKLPGARNVHQEVLAENSMIQVHQLKTVLCHVGKERALNLIEYRRFKTTITILLRR